MFKLNTTIKSTLLLAIGVLFISCGKQEFSKNRLLEYDGKFPDESGNGVEITFSDSGRVSFEIFAPLLNKYNGDHPYMDCPEGVKIVSYDSQGEQEAVLTADYAVSEENPQRMEARSHVVITNVKNGDTLKTEKIIWDKANKRIYSDVEVRQIRSDGTVNIGDGFDADERFTKYTVRNPRGEIIAEDL